MAKTNWTKASRSYYANRFLGVEVYIGSDGHWYARNIRDDRRVGPFATKALAKLNAYSIAD